MGTSSAWLLSCFFHKIPISCDHFFASDTAQGSRFLYTLPAPALESAIALRSPGLSYLEPTIWAPGVLTLVVWFLRLFNRGIKEKRKENVNRQLIPILPIQVQDDRICTESVLSSVRVSIFPRPGYRIAGPHATAPPAVCTAWGLLSSPIPQEERAVPGLLPRSQHVVCSVSTPMSM